MLMIPDLISRQTSCQMCAAPAVPAHWRQQARAWPSLQTRLSWGHVLTDQSEDRVTRHQPIGGLDLPEPVYLSTHFIIASGRLWNLESL